MRKESIYLLIFALFLLMGIGACWPMGEDDDVDPKEAACQKEYECGLLDDHETMNDCSIGVKATRDRLKVVKGNDGACEDLLGEYEDALKCIKNLDCEEMADDPDDDGMTEIDKCWEDYHKAAQDIRKDEDECQACFPEDGFCWEKNNFGGEGEGEGEWEGGEGEGEGEWEGGEGEGEGEGEVEVSGCYGFCYKVQECNDSGIFDGEWVSTCKEGCDVAPEDYASAVTCYENNSSCSDFNTCMSEIIED